MFLIEALAMKVFHEKFFDFASWKKGRILPWYLKIAARSNSE